MVTYHDIARQRLWSGEFLEGIRGGVLWVLGDGPGVEVGDGGLFAMCGG